MSYSQTWQSSKGINLFFFFFSYFCRQLTVIRAHISQNAKQMYQSAVHIYICLRKNKSNRNFLVKIHDILIKTKILRLQKFSMSHRNKKGFYIFRHFIQNFLMIFQWTPQIENMPFIHCAVKINPSICE